jgi:hypothetical protein
MPTALPQKRNSSKDSILWTEDSMAAVDHVDFPVYIVTLGKVRSEVPPAALFSPQRRPGNQSSDCGEMALPPRVGACSGGRLRVICCAEAHNRVLQSRAGAKEADRPPEQVAHLFIT